MHVPHAETRIRALEFQLDHRLLCADVFRQSVIGDTLFAAHPAHSSFHLGQITLEANLLGLLLGKFSIKTRFQIVQLWNLRPRGRYLIAHGPQPAIDPQLST